MFIIIAFGLLCLLGVVLAWIDIRYDKITYPSGNDATAHADGGR